MIGYLQKAMGLVLLVLVGSMVQQINVIIDKTPSLWSSGGSISAPNYASKINDVVIAVFIMAITTVVFLCYLEAFARDSLGDVKRILGQGINIILIITVPATKV